MRCDVAGCGCCGRRAEEMTGDELKPQQKSSLVFKSRDGVKVPGLKLDRKDMSWWEDAKFGLFIHWGLYAIPARGEWTMHNEKIPDAPKHHANL